MDKKLYANVSLKVQELSFDDEPSGIRIVVTDDLAERIRHLAKIVKDNQLSKVELFHNWPEWLTERPNDDHDDPDGIPESDCRLGCVTLNVGDDDFWYEAVVKHTDTELVSDRISLSELPSPEGAVAV